MFSFLKTIPKRKRFLIIVDFLIIFSSLILAFLIIAQKEYILSFFSRFFWLILFIPIFWQISLYLNRAYEIEKINNIFFLLGSFLKTSLAIIVLGFLFYLLPFIDFPQRIFLLQAVFGLGFLLVFRLIFRNLIKLPIYQRNVLILGTGWEAEEIFKELSRHKELGYQIKGFIQDKPFEDSTHLSQMVKQKILGSSKDVSFLLKKEKIDLLILAIPGPKSSQLIKEVFLAEERGVSLIEMAELYEELTGKIPIKHFEDSWQLLTEIKAEDKFQKFLSNLFNLVFAFFSLVILSPFFLLISLAIKIENSQGRIFYFQKRVGERGREFVLVKFRTMFEQAEKETGPVWAKEEDNRQTKVGKILRRFHLDELPQLVNLLKREMNLVGPRPERPEFVKLLQEKIPFYQKRYLSKPGITGWAQTNFKYGASIEDALEKLQYELYYIKHRSFLFDLVICFKTLKKIF